MRSLSNYKGEKYCGGTHVRRTSILHFKFLDLYVRKLQPKTNKWRRKQPMGCSCHRTCRAHMKWLNKSRHVNLIEVAQYCLLSIPRETKIWKPELIAPVTRRGETLAERNRSRRLALLDQGDKWSEEGKGKGCSPGRYEARCLKKKGVAWKWKDSYISSVFHPFYSLFRLPQEIKCQVGRQIDNNSFKRKLVKHKRRSSWPEHSLPTH